MTVIAKLSQAEKNERIAALETKMNCLLFKNMDFGTSVYDMAPADKKKWQSMNVKLEALLPDDEC